MLALYCIMLGGTGPGKYAIGDTAISSNIVDHVLLGRS